MKRLAVVALVPLALGGCLTPSAYRQSHELVGRPLADAVARYGPPDQPVSGDRRAYSWSRGRFAAACELSVRTGPDERITRASVVALGFRTCKSVLAEDHAR